MSPYPDNPLNVLNPRSGCVQCEESAPPCPNCKDGEICTMISQSCNQCAHTKCIPTSSGSNSDSSGSSGSGGTNAGAIAGGVIGGVAFVVIASFLVWWFFIRKKRQEYAANRGPEKGDNLTDPRQSRKSAHSIASTALTRASNVIQIAYIPGVTNRSPPETPNSLVPPVPPLPGAAPDQHFFMPGDLRDSAWTDTSDARSMHDARSIAPSLRSSVATTTYHNNAVVSPMPAQQAMLTRPAVVNVNGNNGSPQIAHLAPADAPAVPAITPAQLAKAGVTDSNSNSNSSSSSNNANSSIVARGMMAKPVMVKGAQKNSEPPAQTIEEQTESGSSAPASQTLPDSQFDHNKSAFDASSSDEEDASGANGMGTDIQAQPSTTGQSVSASGTTSALNHPSGSNRSAQRHRKSASSGLIVGEEESRSSRNSNKVASRVESPFSDANELK